MFVKDIVNMSSMNNIYRRKSDMVTNLIYKNKINISGIGLTNDKIRTRIIQIGVCKYFRNNSFCMEVFMEFRNVRKIVHLCIIKRSMVLMFDRNVQNMLNYAKYGKN